MKYLLSLIVTLFALNLSFSFEGVIHCTQNNNGVINTYDFYVKDNLIAIISKDGGGTTTVLFNTSTKDMKICIDHPSIEQKGYFQYNSAEFNKKDSLQVLRLSPIESITIDSTVCSGYLISTNRGAAKVYYGKEKVDLTGFSNYFTHPIMELLDAVSSEFLPKRISSDTFSGGFSVDLSAESMPLSDSIFTVPSDYVRFEVKLN